jgi:predicted AlkP superfamily phosphohydrolase/phosphomutase
MMHVHYQYVIECSDWYGRPEASRVRDAAMAYFEELDRAIEELTDWVGTDGHVVVVSDHGSGPWEKTVNLNLLLERWGYLKLPSLGSLATKGPIAGAGQRLARRVVPRRLLHRAKARVTRGIRWESSVAFASHVAEQGIHVNERGALPRGFVDPDRVSAIMRQISERLMNFTDPADGSPIVDRVIRREEVMDGPYVKRAPHLFPLCRDQRYELSDTLAATSPVTDHRDRPWGYHHRDGVFIAAGPGVRPGVHDVSLEIVDVLPTLFHLAGLPIPAGLDGTVAKVLEKESVAALPVREWQMEAEHKTTEEYPFTPEEEAAIEESLRGLGYIE